MLVVFRRGDRPLLGFGVAPEDAISTWERLRAITEKTGFYPVVVRDKYGEMNDMFTEPSVESPEMILSKASTLNVQDWLRGLKTKFEHEGSEHQWPRNRGQSAPGVTTFHVPIADSPKDPAAGVWLMLLPTRHGYEAPAYLSFGGWNECPDPEIQVAVLKSWHERFGADLVTMGADILELRVAKPPKTDDGCLAIAEEHYLYCNDIVTQGHQSIDALASSLDKSTVWFFWWD